VAKSPKTVLLVLAVREGRRPAAIRRALSFFHERGIEGHSGEGEDGIPYIQFDKPDWDDEKITELKQDFAAHMGALDIQDSTGEIP
jgi:hypothetical protein